MRNRLFERADPGSRRQNSDMLFTDKTLDEYNMFL